MDKFSQAVAHTIMAIGLIIICLILDYILWKLYFSILIILAFDGLIFFLVTIWGLAWVYSMFWFVIHGVWYLLSFGWTHPYVLLFLIVVLLVLSIVLAILRCLQRRRRAQQIHNTEQTVLSISERLCAMEEKQDDILQRVAPRAEEQAIVREIHSNTENIAALAEEVRQLKTTVLESIGTLRDEVQQLKTKVNESSERIATLTDEVKAKERYSKGDIPVGGERKIWGTNKFTKVKKVEKKIASLTSVSASDLIITKFSNHARYVTRWWFTVTAEESVLLKLQEEWHSVEVQTHWKLMQVTSDQTTSDV